jgi:tetratricopeptide (TPR) repeat protein
MKQALVIPGILGIAIWAAAQGTGAGAQTPAAGQTQPAPAAAQAPAAAAQPAAKRPPQAKTQPEFDAYKAAGANTDPAALEKAADDFATKFPDSELRLLLYKVAMHLYQNANNAEKTDAMGRKVLAIDGDDPDALTIVAEVIAERTRDTDIDRDQRYDEGMKMATKALTTVDTDLSIPAGTPQERVDAFKAGLRSQAYSTMGTIAYNKNDFAAAQANFQKAIDAYPSQPYAPDVLRLALSLDKQATAATDDKEKQQKYGEALKAANRAVELTKEDTGIGGSARRERDRLQQLTGAAAPAAATPPTTPPNQPPKN